MGISASPQPTHAGWVARTKGAGPVVSVSANTDAVGPAATACTYTLVLSGGGTNNTSAQVSVTTAATGRITAVTVTNAGLYTGTPTANTFGNTAFRLMQPYIMLKQKDCPESPDPVRQKK